MKLSRFSDEQIIGILKGYVLGVSGDRAYASISATLTITLKRGEPIIRPGILTFTFGKLGESWKAEGHAWGRLS